MGVGRPHPGLPPPAGEGDKRGGGDPGEIFRHRGARLRADFRQNAVNRATAGAFPFLQACSLSDITLEGFAMKSLISVLLLAAALTAGTAMAADRGDRVERRFDQRGDRIDTRLDRKGDRIDERLDHRADRAEDRGHERHAAHFDQRGDRIENRLDRKGDHADNRLDRHGKRFDRRWDRRR